MYINKIDELIDKVIDDFYLTVVFENKNFEKILREVDYIKFQQEINEIMIKFNEKIDINNIKNLVKSNNAVHQIHETIKRYIAYYLFLTIGYFYVDKDELYINNIIEFTKNQSTYGYKIENFFNSNSNSLLIQYNKIVNNIKTLLTSDESRIDKLKIKPEFKETINFLNELGGEYISSKFQIKNKSLQSHNIIKTLIVIFMYEKFDKKDFFNLLEVSEIMDGEYMFIDIIIPIKKTIDFSAIETVIESTNIKETKYLTEYFWKYLNDYEEYENKPQKSNDDKIIELINSGIVVPITDDFLLFNKESEKYDRVIDDTKTKKKEDTKIKYIVNKIDKIREYYSDQVLNDPKLKGEIKKIFYVQLSHRKAILVNVKEDISIINKFMNIGKHNVENFDYFKDLEQIKSYPYINFNEFENYGFTMQMTKTTDIVRSVSLVKSGEFKQIAPNSIIQTRVGSKDMFVNIVGFMIPSTTVPLQCVSVKNVIDIRSLNDKNKNGFELISQYIKESNLNMSEHAKSVYWLFDENKDIIHMESYEQIVKLTMQDSIKNIVGKLYDNVHNNIYESVVNIFKTNKITSLQNAYKIIEYYNMIFNISNTSLTYSLIESNLYDIIEKNQFEPEYDKNEDIIYGLIGEPEKNVDDIEIEKNIKKFSTIKINASTVNEYGEKKNKDIVDGICQHNITQEKIANIDKKDFTRYSEELYKFIQQYVMINVNEDYICKSCGFSLDIKKYIEEGEYDNESKSFVSYTTPININLEDIIGYDKFKTTIKQIDKIVEKIASVSNILHLSRTTVSVKSKRKIIVKNAIDLINMHNNKIKNKFKEKNAMSSKKYGINGNYSNFWAFELSNNIFVISSNDIDKYKPIKQNNIISYIIFLMMMEINQSHVMYLGDDKKKFCNFISFEKVIDNLFGGLKIIINKRGDIDNILNYKILCYIIYIISCTIATKTKMWDIEHDPDKDIMKKIKQISLIQRSIIHTLVAIINSVIEISIQETNFLYTMLGGKYFKKIQEIYQDESLFIRLKKESRGSSSFDKKESIIITNTSIPLTGKYIETSDYLEPERRTCKCPTMLIGKKNITRTIYNGISNISNCEDGKYHVWKLVKDKLICTLCKKESSDINYDSKISDDIKNKFKNTLNYNLASKICLEDGQLHIFETSESGSLICIKCKKPETYEYSKNELQKVHDLVNKVNTERNAGIISIETDITNFSAKKLEYIKTAVGKLSDEYSKIKSSDLSFLSNLTDEIQRIIGNEFNNVHLTENTYTIDHDHVGNKLDQNIVILNSQEIIFEKKNHPYFKTNVLYYTNHKHKNKKIDIFYDATTKVLLGYKEESKDYVMNKNYDQRIKLNYSILEKIKLMGYTSPFINVSQTYEKLTFGREDNKLDEKIITQNIMENVIKNRIIQLKKILLNLKIILSRILNGYSEEINPEEHYKSKINVLIEKYKKKMLNPNLTDKTGNNLIFKHWKAIINGITIDNIDKMKFSYDFSKEKTLNYNEINKIDNSGNIIIYYLSRELLKFFEYNTNNVMKSIIANFIVDFINTMFDIFNEEKNNNDIVIKKFMYIITSSAHINEIEEKSGAQNLEGIYSEYKDSQEDKTVEELESEKEQIYDDIQENQSLDIDVDVEDNDEDGEERMADYDLGRNIILS
jgi:hypothetical protein